MPLSSTQSLGWEAEGWASLHFDAGCTHPHRICRCVSLGFWGEAPGYSKVEPEPGALLGWILETFGQVGEGQV